MSDEQKMIVSKIINALIVAVGTICNILFAGK